MSAKRFRIAFSFAGEKRDFVGKVAAILADHFGQERILYDKYHEAEFARNDLGIYLPNLYNRDTDLVVVVVCPHYDTKEWTGLEWLAIHDLLQQRKREEVSLCRFESAHVDGLFRGAGFIELDHKTPEELADLILQRLALNEGHPKEHYTKAAAATIPTTSLPHNLPTLQPFFGREDELRKIAAALDPKSRSWGTLIDGDGGRGKTSLAIRAAYDAPPAHFERIVFVSVKQQQQDDHRLRALTGFKLSSWPEMLDAIARELDLPAVAQTPEDQRARKLSGLLEGHRILLVLDNLETLTDFEQDQLFTFLDHLPAGCKALLTSRRFVGNAVLALDLPSLDEPTALRLLAEIAEHNMAFAASDEPARLQLIGETGGNALLLRWTAGQVGRGSCANIADALAHLRSCPDKNDALRFVFGELVASLAPEDVALLAALTHPAQPIRLEDVCEISGVSGDGALARLKTLRNQSLVTSDAAFGTFTLVPMVADFLRQKKPEAVAETGDRLEQRAYALIVENGYRKHARFPVLDAAWPSVAPAMPRFVAGPNARLQTVCDALTDFLNFTGRWDEWLALEQQAEGKAAAAGDHHNAGWRANQAGWVHRLRRQADEVLACAGRATEHWEAAQAGARDRAGAVRLRGKGHQLKGDYPTAIAAYREVLEVCRHLSAESDHVAIILNDLADAERLSGDTEAAERDYREALRVARAVGYAEGVASYTGNLAALALDREDWPTAESLAREALPLSEKVGRQEIIAADCQRIAKALARQGKGAEGLPSAVRAVEIYFRLGSPKLAAARRTLAECGG